MFSGNRGSLALSIAREILKDFGMVITLELQLERWQSVRLRVCLGFWSLERSLVRQKHVSQRRRQEGCVQGAEGAWVWGVMR
jgi:hypothetical protein